MVVPSTSSGRPAGQARQNHGAVSWAVYFGAGQNDCRLSSIDAQPGRGKLRLHLSKPAVEFA
jgi:hypothetical protein